MKYLTVEEVLFIHYRIIEETGGSHGVRELALLESAVQRPSATFSANDLYQDIFEKTSAIMHSMIKNHPFVDGNKRTAIAVAAVFLVSNGYDFTATNKEVEWFAVKAATGAITIEEINRWFKKRSKKS